MSHPFLLSGLCAFELAGVMLASACDASSPDAWAEFREEVKAACLAKAAELKNPIITVDPFGSESYGVALISAEGDASQYVCIFDKKTKAAELASGIVAVSVP